MAVPVLALYIPSSGNYASTAFPRAWESLRVNLDHIACLAHDVHARTLIAKQLGAVLQ
jgi:hypothetical protein